MARGSSSEIADALMAALDELGGERFRGEQVLTALLQIMEEDRRVRSRVLDRARDLLDETDETSIHDLLRP